MQVNGIYPATAGASGVGGMEGVDFIIEGGGGGRSPRQWINTITTFTNVMAST